MSDDRKKPRGVNTAADGVTEQPSQRRRRLVKGALSAPVFLTLQNGSVFANTSNDASVVANDGHNLNDAVAYELTDAAGKPTVNIQCVIPGDGSFENGTQVDFGNHYSCGHATIADGKLVDFNKLTGDQITLAKENGFGQCTGEGGYIVAGSSHASLCH